MQGLPSVAVVFFSWNFLAPTMGKTQVVNPQSFSEKEHLSPFKKTRPAQIWGEARKNSTGFFLPKGPWFHQSSFHMKKMAPKKHHGSTKVDLFRRPSRTSMSMGSPVRARWSWGDDGGSWSQLWARNTPWKWPTQSKQNMTRWCFNYFLFSPPIWGRFPFWRIFCKWIETTNQKHDLFYRLGDTPPKINSLNLTMMVLEDEFPSPGVYSQVPAVNLPGCTWMCFFFVGWFF